MFGRSTGSYDRLLEKATSQLLLEPDWDSILQICDSIRQGDVTPKYVVSSIKKKLSSENPHVCMFALQVLESVVKNCGSTIHGEISTKEFMEYLKDQAKLRTEPVKPKILELIQTWSNAFRNEPGYKAIQDTYHLMKMEGYSFPAMKEADAMFLAEKAPEWKDGECCHRCRVQFSMVQRKHHCRNCGQIFCSKCSSKSSIIPRFGIEREVRVCEACYETLNRPGLKKPSDDDELPPEYLASPLSQQSQVPPQKSEAEIQEEEELMLALAISQSEAESKQKEKSRMLSLYGGSNNTTSNGHSDTTAPSTAQTEAPTVISAPVLDTSDMDPELARYLNRNYWEQKQDVKPDMSTTTQPSAPTAAASTEGKMSTGGASVKVQEKFQNGEVNEEQQFLNALQSSLEIFVNRMKSNSQRGRSIANDSSVQTLFMTINAMHPQLMKYIGEQEDARGHYESLQDKLAQMKDAREALDALREEHREKRRREMEELERQRQIQMAAKLEVMRQKKQEYLLYQQQLAVQRMQEQEREMQMRFEQQKQMQHMRAMQTYYPQMYAQQPGFSPSGSVEGSPHHQPHMGGPPPPGPPGQYPVGGPGQPPVGPPMGVPGGMPPQGPMGGPAPPPNTQPGPPAGPPPPGQPGYGTVQPGFQPPPGPPGGYQPAPPMGYQPQGAPGQQQMAPPPQNQQNYNAYNMQGMANNLPGQGPGGPQQYSQQQPPPPQGYADPQGMPPPGVQNMQPPPPDQQGAPPPQGGPPQGSIAQLISFD